MPWIWSCHKCHTRYLLGATRRCLLDGHYFCGGATIDKFTGKVKKHKACVSEFDYTGWDDFSKWKRAATGQSPRLGSRHCEDECIFPSSCHWNEEHAAQKTGTVYHDDCCLDEDPDVSSIKDTLALNTNILSTIEEEDQKPSSPDATPEVNGLGLHNPVMDLSSSRNGADESGEGVGNPQMKVTMSKSQQVLARLNNIWEEEVEVTDWIAEDASVSRPISPQDRIEAIVAPFDFRFEEDDSLAASLADEVSPVSPVSPMYSTWHWTADDIGVALSPTNLPREDEKVN